MTISELLQYCMAKPGAEQSVHNDWKATQIKVEDVLFAMVKEVENRPAVSLKTSPELAELPFMDLLFGVHPGVLGETCGIAILLGFAWLLVTRTVTFTIPGVYVGTVIVCSLLTGHDVATQVFSGGLLLCAVFMATDYTTSPTTFKGQVIFAVGLGLITCLIRFWGNMNEGAAYSILLMNLVVPYIDSLTATTPVGGEKKRRFARAKKEGGE